MSLNDVKVASSEASKTKSTAAVRDQLKGLVAFSKENPSSLHIALLGGIVFSLLMGAVLHQKLVVFLVLFLVASVMFLIGLKMKTEEDQTKSMVLVGSSKEQLLEVFVNGIKAGDIEESRYHLIRSYVRLNVRVWLQTLNKLMGVFIYGTLIMLTIMFYLIYFNDHEYGMKLMDNIFNGDMSERKNIITHLGVTDLVFLLTAGIVFFHYRTKGPLPFEAEMNYRIRKHIGCPSLGIVELKPSLPGIILGSSLTLASYPSYRGAK
jgi:hypothetical protein